MKLMDFITKYKVFVILLIIVASVAIIILPSTEQTFVTIEGMELEFEGESIGVILGEISVEFEKPIGNDIPEINYAKVELANFVDTDFPSTIHATPILRILWAQRLPW